MLGLEICKDILCNFYNVLVVLLGLETLETIVKLRSESFCESYLIEEKIICPHVRRL